MQDVGRVMHLAGSGRVIIKLSESTVSEGQVLCDKKGTKVAKVLELIGPVKEPFASAVPITNNIKRHVGNSVFVFDQLVIKPRKGIVGSKRRSR